jgi:hypothetical protein
MYYLLKTKLEEIQLLADYTTGNGNINIELMYQNVDLQLPNLTEQQTLQSDFDEIRHKHAKIAVYKAKAQEAIQRLIPGAKNLSIIETPSNTDDIQTDVSSILPTESTTKIIRKKPKVAQVKNKI